MPVTQPMVRVLRGRIRARAIDTIADLNALIVYNTSHPATGLLNAPTITAIQAVTTRLVAQLLAKRLR